jgi:hypothetical protein
MLTRTRPMPLTIAGGVLVVAAVAYLALIVLAVPNGSAYLTALGTEPTPLGTVVVVYGALAIIALSLARQVLADHVDRRVGAGFVAWFGVAVLGAVLVGPLAGAGIALTGLLPLVLVRYGTRAPR